MRILILKKIKWAIPGKKTMNNVFKTGDIFLLKKKKFLGFKTISKSKWRHSCNRSLFWGY